MRRAVVPVAAGVALVLGVAYLLAPLMGTDLSAQYTHAAFAGLPGHPLINFSWYGGINAVGYSPLSPALMWLATPRLSGVVSAVVTTGALAFVLLRTGARRPLLGGNLVAVVAVANLVSGRITFAIGMAFGSVALAALAAATPRRALRLAAASVLAALASLASPIAGLFVGLAAGAILIADLTWTDPVGRARPADLSAAAAPTGTDHRAAGTDADGGIRSFRRAVAALGRVRFGPRLAEALALGVGAAAGIAVTVGFSDGGEQPFDASSMRLEVGLAVMVALAVPAVCRVLRVGAGLTVVLLLFTFYVPTAIGANATRLPMLFAVPVVAAYAAWRWLPLVAVLVAMVWWQSPLVGGDLAAAGSPETHASFFAPLNAELATLGPVGRVEVVPLRDHWESYTVGREVALARGWERQVDVERNPIFYTGRPIGEFEYAAWLRGNAVSYVAIAPFQPLDIYARTEAAVVATVPGFLHPVWHNADWYLFSVTDTDPFVSPGTLVSASPDRIVFDATKAGPVTVMVRFTRWLTVSGGGCATATPDGWTSIRVPAPGRYALGSGLRGSDC